jgi:hypothetical protein
MMNHRRLRWRGAGQQRALLLELQKQLNAWLQGWSVDPELLSLKLVDAHSTLSSDRRWTHAKGSNGSAWLGAPVAMLEGFGGLLAKASSQDSLGLGSRVGERALRALLAQWLGGPSTDIVIVSDSAPGSEEMQARFGGFRFSLEGEGFSGTLIIDSELCDHWVPMKRPTMSALAARESALGHEEVVLQVTLDLGELSLADTHGLQVGDVLVSSTPLDSNFMLTHPDARQIAIGRLFRQGSQRALQINAANPMRKPS